MNRIVFFLLTLLPLFAVSQTFQWVNTPSIKFSWNGNLLWYYEPQTNGEPVVYCKAMAIDASDQIYLGFNDYENAYIEKLSPQAGLLETIVQQHAHDQLGKCRQSG